MGEELIPRSISYQDLNMELVDIQELSYTNNSASRLSNKRLYVSNQFSMNSFPKVE